MTERIFISYRRDDSAGHAGRVFDRAKHEFGQDVLFMDVDAIPLGASFVKVLRDEVAKCSVLLAVIGPRWLDAQDEDGDRRLDNPNDFVRIEIATALTRDIPVIPILLEGARIPKVAALPPDLHELSQRNGLDVRHASFHADMDKLVRGLKARKAAPQVAAPPVAPPQLATIVQPAEIAAPPPRLPLVGSVAAPLTPVPTVDEVIANAGRWQTDFNVDPSAAAPLVFSQLFMRVQQTHTASLSSAVQSGSILTGKLWDGSRSPFWHIVHGATDNSAWCASSLDWVTYLGPTWRPEYAELSDAVFKRLGGVPLARFIKHP